MSKFVEPKTEKPQVIYHDEQFRIVKQRTQIPTGEWNKELIIEALSGKDALGNSRWVELTNSYLKSHIARVPLHELSWQALRQIAEIVCREEGVPDYDYIYYINKGRYRVKGEPKNDAEG